MYKEKLTLQCNCFRQDDSRQGGGTEGAGEGNDGATVNDAVVQRGERASRLSGALASEFPRDSVRVSMKVFRYQGKGSENSSFTKFYKKCAFAERVNDTSAEKFYGIKIDV
jgi:hypothetical protein